MRRPRDQMRSQPREPKSRGRQHGVALIEALVSILIFSFGVLGLVGLEASAVGFSVDAENRNRAALLANEVASTMWLNSSVTLTGTQSAAFQTKVSDQTQGGLPGGTLGIAQIGTTNSADITITWKPPRDPAAAPNRQLTTRVILP